MTFKGSDLLSPIATRLQRLWADARWGRTSAIDVEVIRTILDPATCPAALLPWLAYQFSVDVWDTAWPEATKRAVIAAAPEVHRLKGTRRAVRLALETLGLTDVDILEWWEAEPVARRGTFRVTLWNDGSGLTLDLALVARVREAIRAAKPKSRVLALRLGARATGGVVYCGLAAHNRVTVTVGPEP